MAIAQILGCQRIAQSTVYQHRTQCMQNFNQYLKKEAEPLSLFIEYDNDLAKKSQFI